MHRRRRHLRCSASRPVERCFSIISLVLALLFSPTIAMANSPPFVSLYPTVSPDPVIADDATPFTVTMTATDSDGYTELRDMRVLFDFTEAAGEQSEGRGYLAWGVADSDIIRYGGVWVLADAANGGRWAYRTDAWGGTTYITPLSCAKTDSGSAAGAPGSRTIAWTCAAKPAWALNPLMNDADVWIADYTFNVAWQDNPVEFDVLAQACSFWSPTPGPPVVSNPTPTTLDVAINPNDSATDLFALRISPDLNGKSYIQQDGSIAYSAVGRTRAGWGLTTVTGLMWDTTYTIAARAADGLPGHCPSPFGAGDEGTTTTHVPRIDHRQGTAFNPAVRGQCPYRSISESGTETLWDITVGSSGRGLAGGLDADTYDWRDIDSGANWGLVGAHTTTLEFLRYARDHEAIPVLTANAFGGGYKDPGDGTFICQTVNPEGLAADWVRYANMILQNQVQGDEAGLTGENLRVYDSIANWQGREKLRAPGEPATPAVFYWEIGNEPEVGGIGTFLSNHYLSPTDYRDRYQLMSQAMLAVDPALKIGPCLINPSDPNGSGQWLAALAANPGIPIDFVAYHPYYSGIKSVWGSSDAMTDGLRNMKAYLTARAEGIRDIMAQHGRTNYKLLATEWNPVNWDAPGQQQRSVAAGLGVAETVFTLAEDGVDGGYFWEQPQSKLAPRDVFDVLRDHMGDILVSNVQTMGLGPDTINWRIYATRHADDENALMIWGLNFNEEESVAVDLDLSPCRVSSANVMRYGQPGDDASGGDTSLMHSSGMVWEQMDATESIDPLGFTFTMDDAEVTVLIIRFVPVPQVDFNRDGDVDLDDFGRFQACFTTLGNPLDDPDCEDANLDHDSDVDKNDLAVFLGCLSGENVTARPDCTD